MTVSELIEQLSKLPQNKRIVVAQDIDESENTVGGTICSDPIIGVTEKGNVYITTRYDYPVSDYRVDRYVRMFGE
jgi:hypothetical protein